MATKKATGLEPFHPAVREWFNASFPEPTRAQQLGWPAIANGDWTLIFAPTGSGKTLTAFLWALDRLMFTPRPPKEQRCRVIYISPLKALAVDVERNLRAPLAGIANVARERGDDFVIPEIATRTGDTPQSERARFSRDPADILITTPESLYLLMTSNARDVLRGVETVIIDEIHALVPGKRGAHMVLSLERMALRCEKQPQRIGLSATQRPLEEVARFLGGAEIAAVGAVVAGPVGEAPTAPKSQDYVHEEFAGRAKATFRPVTIVDTGEKKKLHLRVEVPVADMAKVAEATERPDRRRRRSGPRSTPACWS
jgi:ATP-dependent Lhr-like helicase